LPPPFQGLRPSMLRSSFAAGSQINSAVQFTREDDHDKRQPSTSLSGGTIHFFSSCSITTCNDIIFIHQGASLKDKRAFPVEKYAFSWRRRHFPRVVSDLTYGVKRFHYPCIYILNTMYRSKLTPGVGCQETPLGGGLDTFCFTKGYSGSPTRSFLASWYTEEPKLNRSFKEIDLGCGRFE
jgi:hypothetical protein